MCRRIASRLNRLIGGPEVWALESIQVTGSICKARSPGRNLAGQLRRQSLDAPVRDVQSANIVLHCKVLQCTNKFKLVDIASLN